MTESHARHGSELAYLSFSDYHGKQNNDEPSVVDGKCLGQVYSIAKLSHKSFQALRMALSDPQIRLTSTVEDNAPVFIIGCAIQSKIIREKDEKFCFIRFNPEMNCIIGARGTGKSTILEIIQHIISLDSNRRIEERYFSAVLYISVNNKVYAIRHEPRVRSYPDIQVYVKNGKNNFTPSNHTLSSDLKKVIAVGYRQRQLYEYSKNPRMILEIVDAFIKWKYNDELEKAQSQVNALYKKLEDMLKSYVSEASRSGKRFLDYIDGNNLNDENLVPRICNLHRTLAKKRNALHSLRAKMIDELNRILDGRVNLTLSRTTDPEKWDYYLGEFCSRVMHRADRYLDYKVEISKCLEKKIFALGRMFQDDFDFFRLLLEKNYEQIISQYKIKLTAKTLANIRECLTDEEILFSFDSTIQLRYNINTGRHAKEMFRDGGQLSLGQHAVALLLLVLDVSYELSDSRPLLMDQPEDDLDNSYIYNTLVSEFRNSKAKRQIIISTHNANIPVASDAENIIVLGFDGSSGFVSDSGSLDRPSIAESVIDTLEGGREAMRKRQAKYVDCI